MMRSGNYQETSLREMAYTNVTQKKFFEIVQRLREERKDIVKFNKNEPFNFFIKHKDNGDTLIHEFVRHHDCVDILDFLIKHAGLDINCKNYLNLAPIHVAAQDGSLEVCQLLYKYKANTQLLGGAEHRHPVFFAINEGEEGKVAWFLETTYKETELDMELLDLILTDVPKAAKAFFDRFARPVGGGSYYFTKGGELYGSDRNNGSINLILRKGNQTAGDILSHRAIRRVLNVKWEAFARQKYLWEVIVYAILVFCFTVPNIFYVNQDTFVDMEGGVKWNIALAFKIITWMISGYHFYMEWKEFNSQGIHEYFSSFWNWINFLTHLSLLATIPLEFISHVEKHRDYILAFVSVFLWASILQFVQVYKTLGPMVSMMGKMIQDISKLLFLFLIIQVGFAGAFYYVFHGNDGYKSFFDSWMTIFLFMFGQIDYSTQFYKAEGSAYYIGSIFLVWYMLIVTIILYNMLIALMASTYLENEKASDKEAIKAKAETILRLEKKLDDKVWKAIYERVTAEKPQAKVTYGTFHPELNLQVSPSIHHEALPTLEDSVGKGTRNENSLDLDKEVPKILNEISHMKEQLDALVSNVQEILQNRGKFQ